MERRFLALADLKVIKGERLKFRLPRAVLMLFLDRPERVQKVNDLLAFGLSSDVVGFQSKRVFQVGLCTIF